MGQVPDIPNGDPVDSIDWNAISDEFTIQDRINNDMIVRIAELEFENNLDNLNYDGGFFLIWSSLDKVGTSVTQPFSDGFEDNNTDQWTPSGASVFQAQTGTVLSGTYSLEYESSSSYSDAISDTFNATENADIEFELRISSSTSSTADRVALFPQNSSGSNLGQLKFNDDGTITWFNGADQSVGSWSTSTTYSIKLEVDNSSGEVEIFIDGSSKGVYSLSNNNSLERFELKNWTGNSGETRTAFFDEFKVTKTTKEKSNVNITTGTRGNIKLLQSSSSFITSDLIDDFETGSIAGDWSGITGNFTAQTGTVLSGTYSGQLTAANEFSYVRQSGLGDVQKSFIANIQIGSDTGNPNDVGFQFTMGTNSQDEICEIRFEDSTGNVTTNQGANDTGFDWSPGTQYTIIVIPDYSANEYELKINGTSVGVFPFRSGNPTGIDTFDIEQRTSNSGATRELYVDDIRIGDTGYPSSGDVTSIDFDLSNDLSAAPNTAVLSQQVSLPGDSDIQYILDDTNGNTKTVTQSDVDTEVDVSNFTSQQVNCKIELTATSDQSETPVNEDVSAHFKV